MRAGELLHRRVADAAGREIGRIREIRAGTIPRDGVPRLEVRGVVVGRTRVRLFGFQRHDQRGPAPLVVAIRWLHRHTRYIDWEDLDLSGPEPRVRKRYEELVRLTDA